MLPETQDSLTAEPSERHGSENENESSIYCTCFDKIKVIV
jgi:hypothetical protein